MATYTGTPSTVAAGETILASLWNSDVRDPVAALSGAWGSYSPTQSGFTTGNGTLAGSYIRVGAFIVFQAKFTFGSTSAGATATPALSLPVTGTGVWAAKWGQFLDASNGNVYTAGVRGGTTTITTYILGSSGAQGTLTISTPFGANWATSDAITVGGVYEAA